MYEFQTEKELKPKCWICGKKLSDEEIWWYTDVCTKCYLEGNESSEEKHPDDPCKF